MTLVVQRTWSKCFKVAEVSVHSLCSKEYAPFSMLLHHGPVAHVLLSLALWGGSDAGQRVCRPRPGVEPKACGQCFHDRGFSVSVVTGKYRGRPQFEPVIQNLPDRWQGCRPAIPI